MGHSQIICLKSVDEVDYTWLAPASIQAWEGKVRVAGRASFHLSRSSDSRAMLRYGLELGDRSR